MATLLDPIFLPSVEEQNDVDRLTIGSKLGVVMEVDILKSGVQ